MGQVEGEGRFFGNITVLAHAILATAMAGRYRCPPSTPAQPNIRPLSDPNLPPAAPLQESLYLTPERLMKRYLMNGSGTRRRHKNRSHRTAPYRTGKIAEITFYPTTKQATRHGSGQYIHLTPRKAHKWHTICYLKLFYCKSQRIPFIMLAVLLDFC
jgi:hypothetical protein